MAQPARPMNKNYQRSWKNYLLDDRYQLNFTLFMVVITALIVTGLALFIKKEVRKATTIAISDVRSKVDEGFLDEVEAEKSIDTLRGRRRMISYGLVGMDLVLLIGLTMYGIKMTHKVAGPLHKVQTYLDKVKAGKYDKVYSLRKGDQLVGFYEQFKEAHESLRHRQEADVARLKDVIAVAEREAGGHPQAGEALAELKAVLKAKEASLV